MSKVKVAGITHRNKGDEFTTLKPSGRVEFKHDKTVEKYDKEAVAVIYEGIHIGYLPNKLEDEKELKRKVVKDPASIIGEIVSYSYFDQDKGWNDDHIGRLQSMSVDVLNASDASSYVMEGKEYTRITNLLKHYNPSGDMDPLIAWAMNQGSFEDYKKKLQELADAGTQMHLQIENYLNGDKSADVPVGFLNFMKKFEPEVLGTEKTVYDDDLMVAGTYDAMFLIGGKKIVVDWKSSKKVHDKHRLQGSFYGINENADETWVLAFGAKTKQGYSLSKVSREKMERMYNTVGYIKDAIDS